MRFSAFKSLLLKVSDNLKVNNPADVASRGLKVDAFYQKCSVGIRATFSASD